MTKPPAAQNRPESGDVLLDLPPTINNLTQEQLIDLLEQLAKITPRMELVNRQFERLRQNIIELEKENAELRQTTSQIKALRLQNTQLKQENHRLRTKTTVAQQSAV